MPDGIPGPCARIVEYKNDPDYAQDVPDNVSGSVNPIAA